MTQTIQTPEPSAINRPQYGHPTFQPPQQRPPEQLSQQPVQPIPPVKKGGGGRAVIVGIIAALAGLTIGGVGGSLAGGGAATAGPNATVTVTATATATKTVTEQATEAPTDQPTDEPAGYTPHKSDFTIGIKILTKQCFGSAGCLIDFRIKPEYVGSQDLPDSGTIEVTYRVSGAEDPIENSFTIEGGSASYDKEESTQTASSSSKLVAKVIDVSYDG